VGRTAYDEHNIGGDETWIISVRTQRDFWPLTPLEPKCNMGEPMKTFVAAIGNVGIEDGSPKSFLFVSDNDESTISITSGLHAIFTEYRERGRSSLIISFDPQDLSTHLQFRE